MASEAVHIVCYGNELHGDDGIGPAVWRHLNSLALPPQTRLFRADISGISSVACFEGCQRALIVDAVSGFGEPGSLHVLEPSQVAAEEGASAHGAGVGGLMRMLPAVLECMPGIRLIGIEIAEIRPFSLRLSDPVAAAVVPAARLVLEQALYECQARR